MCACVFTPKFPVPQKVVPRPELEWWQTLEKGIVSLLISLQSSLGGECCKTWGARVESNIMGRQNISEFLTANLYRYILSNGSSYKICSKTSILIEQPQESEYLIDQPQKSEY